MCDFPVTLVCFAVKEEATPFRRTARGQPDIEVVLTGMGARNAEKAIRAALTTGRPSLVLSAGFAGGLRPGLSSGSVVFSAEGQPELEKSLRGAGAKAAKFHFVARVATNASQKRELREQTGADAVEMESQVIRSICQEQGIPSATVRVILDTANDDLPLDFNELMTDDQELDGRKLARAVLKSPGKISGLLRLQKQSASAARRLAGVLEQVLLHGSQASKTKLPQKPARVARS
jgi:adenosylhomocysteine nucleosidase